MNSETFSTRRLWLRTPFVLTCVVLVSVAVGVAFAPGRMQKRSLEIRKPLSSVPHSAFGPRYKFMQSSVLPPTVVDALGTDEYLSWVLEDRSVAEDSSVRYVNLSVTYYDTPDQIPHTPDVCMIGAGYKLVAADTLDMAISSLSEEEQPVPVRVVTFEKSEVQGNAKPTVLYTFRVNDDFACSRYSVRTILFDVRATGGFYSKVELSFSGVKGLASPEESIEATRSCLSIVLPVLLSDYWPERGAAYEKNEPANEANEARES